MVSKKVNETGFTMIELLIVVAIIGVLATIGIPTFKKMIQKSKKSEAKVALGALYNAEAAFFAEYNTYGNRVEKIGFELEGSVGDRFYDVGFPDAACLNQATSEPSIGTALARLTSKFPAYYAGPTVTVLQTGNGTVCDVGTVSPDGSTFIASASGMISPDPAAVIDIWRMDNSRSLSNNQDGVK